jgi:tetratricopeptide (TPR) repeat protein
MNTRCKAGVLLCGLLLAGCATPPQTRQLLYAHPDDVPVVHEIVQTPFFPQDRYQCGPAALATVLSSHGVDITPDALVEQVYTPGLTGSMAEELTATARRYGMLAYPLSPLLKKLLAEVAQDHPVLVLQNLGLGWVPRWHFAVVVGYDLDAQTLLLRSGTTRRWTTPLATFERTWARGRHRAWVIVPAGTVPHTAEALPYLRSAQALERTGKPGAARQAWLAGTVAWPENFRAWMALGNSYYATGEFAAATPAFLRATKLSPLEPAGWNNLAYALVKNRCPHAAQQAASCARQLAPDNAQYRQTADEIAALAVGDDAADCPSIPCTGAQQYD